MPYSFATEVTVFLETRNTSDATSLKMRTAVSPTPMSANTPSSSLSNETPAGSVHAVSAVQDVSGALLQEYATSDGRTLNPNGVNQILQYLRYHALS